MQKGNFPLNLYSSSSICTATVKLLLVNGYEKVDKLIDEGMKCPRCRVAMNYLNSRGSKETLYFFCNNCRGFFTVGDDNMEIINPVRDKVRIAFLEKKYNKSSEF